MSLNFLPYPVRRALDNLNARFVTEIRLRSGQLITIEYKGEYVYLGNFGVTEKRENALICQSADDVLCAATDRSVYFYSEQLKRGFITVDGGVRIGVGGEYVTENGTVVAVKNATSLNIRLPHRAEGCADGIYSLLFAEKLCNALIFSPPDVGKTTVLRDLAVTISKNKTVNILVFDERYELSAYDLGERCDIVRGADKLTGFSNAIRALKPNVIITDELYGERDMQAIKYAVDCGLTVVASSHVCDESILSQMPFDYFVRLTKIGGEAVIYDKAFNIVGNSSTLCRAWRGSVGEQEKA